MHCEPEESQKLELLHTYINMAYSSVQHKASVAFLIIYFMVYDCLSVSLYINSTNSELTPMNNTISMDYRQSVSYDVNERISTIKTSQEAEAKPQSYLNKIRNDVNFSKDEETSLMKNVKNNLTADNSHNGRFHRSKRSTVLSVSSEILKWINYLANCAESNCSECHSSCSFSSNEVCCCYSVHLHLYAWKLWWILYGYSIKHPTRYTINLIFIALSRRHRSTCFGHCCAHHQEPPPTAFAASGCRMIAGLDVFASKPTTAWNTSNPAIIRQPEAAFLECYAVSAGAHVPRSGVSVICPPSGLRILRRDIGVSVWTVWRRKLRHWAPPKRL
jgi:hypothetical protein